ncbi:MAG: XRE family transcriptional regulator [Duncaniella sp.]|nr:XRE family transcriptional regulator [Duncaniella sp.]
MDLVSRLKQYLDSRQISVTQFADECGIPRPTASQLLAGRNKKVSDEIIGKIHQCYPDLNVIWLMFGEGNMSTGRNIEISEPQTEMFFNYPTTSRPGIQPDTLPQSDIESILENQAEKNNSPAVAPTQRYSSPAPSSATSEFSFHQQQEDAVTAASSTFDFATPPANPSPLPRQPLTQPAAEQPPRPITLMPGKGKRVTGIVVYYDDSTYESFIPDSDHTAPFLR